MHGDKVAARPAISTAIPEDDDGIPNQRASGSLSMREVTRAEYNAYRCVAPV